MHLLTPTSTFTTLTTPRTKIKQGIAGPSIAPNKNPGLNPKTDHLITFLLHVLSRRCPPAWIASTAFGSGKTEAMKLGLALACQAGRPPFSGDSSKPGTFDMLSQQADLVMGIDDVVTNAESRSLATQVDEILEHA